MKNRLLLITTSIVMLLCPNMGFSQAPTLGSAQNFVLFSTVGAVTNTGITHLTGNVGTNSGSSTGFGNVDGVMHNNDVASGQCATDLGIAYGQLDSATATFFPSSTLGNGATLVPGVYRIPTAATMNGTLTLDGQGSANSVFIFQIQGAFATNSASKVVLINGALACNVFWKVEGLVGMASGTTMRGTIVAHNAAINMNAGDSLEGRALSIAGAVTVSGITAFTPIGCGSPLLTGPIPPALASTKNYGLFSSNGPVSNSGVTHITGDVGTNLGLTTGFNPLFVTGMIHPIPDASTATCAADLHNVYMYLNPLPADIELLYPAQFGNNLVLTPHTYVMNAATTLTDSLYLNAEGDSAAVFVIKIYGALSTSTYSKVILINGAKSKNVYWLVNGAVAINDNSIFNGTIVANNGAIQLNTGVVLNGRALSTTGAVTVTAMTINADTTSSPTSSTINGPSNVCVGSSITLTDTTATGIWTISNANATISITGVVTGVTPGLDTVTYLAGAASATKVITIDSTPTVNAVANQVVCNNSATSPVSFSGSVAGTTYTWSNNTPSIGLTGTGAGNIASFIAINAGNSPVVATVVITPSANGCNGNTKTFTYTVNPTASVNAIANQIVCNNSATSPVNFSGSVTGTTYIWSNNTPSIGLAGTGAGNIASFIATNAGNSPVVATVVVTPSANACNGSTKTFTYTVNPTPSVNSVANQTECNNTATNPVGFTGSVTGTSYTWTNNAPSIGLPGTGLGNIGSFIASNVFNSPVTATVVVTPVANGCNGSTMSFTYTVNPTADVNAIPNQVVCNGNASSPINFSSGVTGTTYTWTNNTTSIGLAGTGTGNIGSFTTINNGVSPIVATVTVDPSANGCNGPAKQFTITVNPTPQLSSSLTPPSICNSTLFSYTPTSLTAGAVFSWSRSNQAGISNAASSGINNPNEILTNTSPNPISVVYVDTLIANGCVNTQDVFVTVNPSAVLSGPLTNSVCSNSPFFYTATSLTNNATFAWTRAAVTNITPSTASGTIDINEVLLNPTSNPINVIYHFVLTINGCSNAEDMTLTVNPLPAKPDITTSSATTVCANTLFVNFGTSTPPAANVYYTWSGVNAIVWTTGSNGQNALVNFTTAGNAEVILTQTIFATLCSASDTFRVTVGTDLAIMPTVRYFESHFICDLNNLDSYQWGYDDIATLDSTLLPGEINQDYLNVNPDFAHKYYWVNTSHNGCRQKTYFNAPTAIQNVNTMTGIDIYPNPAKEWINVQINAPMAGAIQIEVLNIAGQKLSVVEAAGNTTRINVSSLPAGFYMVHCYSKGISVGSARFIKN